MIEFCQNIKSKFQKAFFLLFYKSSFSAFGLRSTLLFPFKVNGAKYIRIGKKVHINEQAWLLSQQIDEQDPKIEIGDYTYIGRNAHIVSVRDVKIVIMSTILIIVILYFIIKFIVTKKFYI